MPVKPGAAFHVLTERSMDTIQFGDKSLISRELFKPELWDAPDQLNRIVSGIFPDIAIQTIEQLDRIDMPVPPEIVSDFTERFERFRKRGLDDECLYRMHAIPSLAVSGHAALRSTAKVWKYLNGLKKKNSTYASPIQAETSACILIYEYSHNLLEAGYGIGLFKGKVQECSAQYEMMHLNCILRIDAERLNSYICDLSFGYAAISIWWARSSAW